MGKSCQRIQLDCLSSVSTSDDVIKDGHATYQNQTCHPDTQFCVTAVKGDTVWRGCGPPVVKVGGERVRERETDRQTDRQAGRQTNRQTD